MAMSTVPIDREALERCATGFGLSVGLPGEAYTSPEVLAWERERFLDRSWVCLGRAGTHRRVGRADRARRVGVRPA